MITRCASGLLSPYSINRRTVLLMAIRSAVISSKEVSGEFNFEKFKTNLNEKLQRAFDLTQTDILQEDFNNIIKTNNYKELQGHTSELQALFSSQGNNLEVNETAEDGSQNIEDVLSGKEDINYGDINKDIYRNVYGINLFRSNQFKIDIVGTILLDGIHLISSNKKLNLSISKYKESQYLKILQYVQRTYPNNSFSQTIYDREGNYIFSSDKTLQCFKKIFEDMEDLPSRITVEQNMLSSDTLGDTEFLQALNSYVNLKYFNSQLTETLDKMIQIKSPNNEGFKNIDIRYALENSNQLHKNWSDDEIVDAFDTMGKLSNLLIHVIPYFTTDGKRKQSVITPVIYTKALSELTDACLKQTGQLREFIYNFHGSPKRQLTNIFREIYEKGNDSVLRSLDQQDKDVLFSIYKHLFSEGGLIDQEYWESSKTSRFPVSSCYIGVADRVVPMNYQMVKYSSFADSYNLGLRPKYYSSKVIYDTAQDLNRKADSTLINGIKIGKQSLSIDLNDHLTIVFQGELLSNKNGKIKVTYHSRDIENNQVWNDITDQVEKELDKCIDFQDGQYTIRNENYSTIFNFINDTLGLRDKDMIKSYIMQQLQSSSSQSFLRGMVVSSGKILAANYVYNDFYKNIQDSKSVHDYKETPITDVVKFVQANYKIYGLEDISFKISQGQNILTPIVAEATTWLENMANALTIMDEGQATSTTTDAFGHHQPNYRTSCLGSIPWFYFNDCKENEQVNELLTTIESEKTELNRIAGDPNSKELYRNLTANLINLQEKLIEVTRNASQHLLTSRFPEAIKQVNVSQEVELKGGIKKKIKDMQFSELMYNSIIYNFYGKYYAGYGYNIQPVTYSDKTTFYNYLVDPEMKINGLKSLDTMTKDEKIQAMVDSIGKMYNSVAHNVLSDITDIFKNDEGFPKLQNFPDFMQYVNAVDQFLKANISEAELISRVGLNSLQLDVHYQKNGNTVKLNPLLMYNGFVLYNDKEKLTLKFKQEEQKFIDILTTKNAVFYTKIKNKPTEVSKMFYTYMNNDKEANSWIENDKLILSKNGVMNPFLENYFYTESLLSNNLRIGLMGSETADPLKLKVGDSPLTELNSDTMNKAESNVQNTSYKRANIIPATLSTVLQQENNGVTEMVRVSVIRDIPASVWNFNGVSDKAVDSMDGSALILPFQSILENGALQDQGVGDDKKSIWHAFHKDTCSACLLKFATYVISNERMRYSELSDTSLYNMFKKMTNEQWTNVDLGNKLLTAPVYYEKFNKFYKIVGFGKDGDKYYTYEAEADKTGHTSGESVKVYHMFNDNSENFTFLEGENIPEGLHTINSVFELHSALGGIYSNSVIDGVLRPSESSNFAVTDFMNKININGHQPLKESVIAYLANNSAVKRGARNINQTTTWNDNVPLSFMNIKSYGLGVQMDPDHEKDDAEITQFTQVITALEAGGRLHEQASEVYRSLGTVAHMFCKTELDSILGNATLSPDQISQVYEILGKSVIDNYSKQNNGELGQTIVSKIEKEFNLNLDHQSDSYKIPFSDSAIYSSIIPTYVSLINKGAIKGKYPGLGAILCPGFSYMQLFKIGNEHYFSEDIYNIVNKKLQDETSGFTQYFNTLEVPKSNYEYHKFLVKSYLDYIQDPDIEEELKRGDTFIGEHEMYKPNKESFKPSDTVFIKLISDTGSQKLNIVLDTIEKYYDFKSMETLPFLIKYGNVITVENPTIIKYADSVSKSRDLAPTNLSWSYNVGNEVHFANVFDVDAIKNHAGTDAIQEAFDAIKLHGTFVMNGQTYNITPGTLVNEEAQAVMSNMYANTFGTEGLTLGQSKNYYSKILNGETPPAVIKVDNGNYYDMAFVNGKNRHLYITFNPVIEDDTSQFYPKELKFKYTKRIKEDGIVYIYASTKEGQLLYKIGYVDENSEEHNYIKKYTVTTKNAKGITGVSIIYNIDKRAPNVAELIRKVYYSNSYKNIEFNKLSSNKQFMSDLIPHLEMNQVLQDHIDRVNSQILTPNTWDNYDNLKQMYYSNFNKEIATSFQKSLYFTAARTPAQALQSFMKMKIIGFTKSAKNRVYVSHFQTYLQGSDYDIDKSYMMGFAFDDNGKYINWSPLFSYNSVEELQASENLPFPTGKLLQVADDGEDIKSFEDAINGALNDADRINKYADLILYLNNNNITKVKRYSYIVVAINEHQQYINKISPLLLQKAIKNSISAKIQNIVQDVRNIYDAYQPVSADELHASVDSKQTAIYVALNPATKYLMQEENMIGKNVIGVAANGEKVYYTSLFYFNDQLRHNPENINNIRFSSTFNRIEGRSTGNPIAITKTTIGNINFENSKILKESLLYVKNNTKVDQMISQLLTAATDNAKELVLAKMNAGMNLAGVHVHLMMLGFNIKDIVSYMTSPAVSAIDFLSKANVFDPKLPKSSVEFALSNLFGRASSSSSGVSYSGLDTLRNNLLNDINDGNDMLQLATKILRPFVQNKSDIDSIIADILEFKTLQDKAAETTRLAQVFFGVNQGLPNSSEGIINMLNKIKDTVKVREKLFVDTDSEHNKLNIEKVIQNNPTLTNVEQTVKILEEVNMVGNFNIDDWIRNTQVTLEDQRTFSYQELTSMYYNLIKGTWNVFDMIDKIPQYKKMFDIFRVVATIQDRFITRDRVVKYVSSNMDFLSEDKIKRISSYIDNLLILRWVNKQDFTLNLKTGDQKYNVDAQLKSVSIDQDIPLNTLEGLATFKRYMENVLIPKLQSDSAYENNAFVQGLINGYDKFSFKKLDMDMLNIEGNIHNTVKFDKYLQGFKDLGNEKVGNMTMTDAFMLYNLIVNKNKYGSDRLTSLFQQYLDQNTGSNILTDYYKSVGELDYNNNQDIAQLLKDINFDDKDLQTNIARTVNTTDYQKDDYLKTLIDGQLTLMKRIGNDYKSVGLIVPPVQNEERVHTLLRAKNYLNDFTFGTLQIQTNQSLIRNLDSDDKFVQAMIGLTVSGKVQLELNCN